MHRMGLPMPRLRDKDTSPHGVKLLTPLAGRVRLRGLTPADAPAIKAHFLRLTPEARRLRFHGNLRDEAICAYVDRIDWPHSYAFGAFVGKDLRAMAELAPCPDGGTGEVALSVEEDLRGQGLGRVLVVLTMLAARRVGMSSLHLFYMADNHAMRSLASNMGARPIRDGSTIDGVISVPAPATGHAA